MKSIVVFVACIRNINYITIVFNSSLEIGVRFEDHGLFSVYWITKRKLFNDTEIKCIWHWLRKSGMELYVAFCICNTRMVVSQRTVSGMCSQFGKTQVPFFTMIPYMGLWYIQGRYDYASTPDLADCMRSVYTKTSWGNAKILERSKILKTNMPYQIDSLMVFNRPLRGHYTYQIPADGVTDWPVDIIATDYISFSIEWSCFNNGSSSDSYVWVLSRTRYVDNFFNARISKILSSHNIDETSIRKINQDAALCGN